MYNATEISHMSKTDDLCVHYSSQLFLHLLFSYVYFPKMSAFFYRLTAASLVSCFKTLVSRFYRLSAVSCYLQAVFFRLLTIFYRCFLMAES
jgi:hypothetical protein